MKIFGMTTPGLELAARSLDLTAASAAQAAANIANSETPGYKAQQMRFEEMMAQALQATADGGMAKTHPRHLPITDIEKVMPMTGAVTAPARIDGNTVDMDQEMSRVAEMNINYAAYTTIAGKEIGILKSALSGSAQ